jgi:hypothetical protein
MESWTDLPHYGECSQHANSNGSEFHQGLPSRLQVGFQAFVWLLFTGCPRVDSVEGGRGSSSPDPIEPCRMPDQSPDLQENDPRPAGERISVPRSTRSHGRTLPCVRKWEPRTPLASDGPDQCSVS